MLYSKEDINLCPFTGLPVKPEAIFDVLENPLLFKYKNPVIKELIISHTEYISFKARYEGKDIIFIKNNYIYQGIIRHHYERYKKPLHVTRNLIDIGYMNFDYPKNFNQKVYYFLRYLYHNGGAEYKTFRLSCNDYPILFADNYGEFQRIIEFIKDKGFIEYKINPIIVANGTMVLVEFRLSIQGMEEIKKELPVMPLWDLIKQDVFTGDTSIDEKISHAKKLFFRKESTFDDKRSACETLSYILEPLREKLKTYFTKADTSDFFNLVNNFDIRHNKERTKQIERIEQLEWIYYSLLNTIIQYFKLIKKENNNI